ncbi:alpha/beta fold hydrolase [Nocardia terpenica]|uniref:Alpha/beta fold hydrolase n=1 Tax=Nocardia terpenica TaxID=455432 RepID=A0A6G9Z0L5_9NOCA|nr:alpha/beta hydrolase [Nocardia terpenica]QIS19012.1 alpha/beta fold hydrolase [Nocardia terpenica]
MSAELDVLLDGRRFGYVDFGPQAGIPVLALHGHFGRGRMFGFLGEALAPEYRVLALDQRGHGRTAVGGPFDPDEYVADAAAFVRHLGLGPIVVCGHSMGGIIAYRLAARHPELVRALVLEESAAVVGGPEVGPAVLDVSHWPRGAAGREQLAAVVTGFGAPVADYFLDNTEFDGSGWRFPFDPADMMASQRALIGDWWPDWLGSDCPALLVHGGRSTLLPTAMARAMTARRPGTTLVVFPESGHFVHLEERAGFLTAVRDFLGALPRP